MAQRRSFGWVAGGTIGTALLAGCAGPMLSDRECMTRAMYFESNRSSPDGMLAVGTTVMNRLAAPGFPKSVCGVVGQPRQYADGVLSKPMNPRLQKRVEQVADSVLSGERHPQVGGAMFFHTAGTTFPYRNMHYVAVAGGNAFYEKRSPSRWTPDPPAVAEAAPARPPYRASLETPAEAEPQTAPQSIDDLIVLPASQSSPLVQDGQSLPEDGGSQN